MKNDKDELRENIRENLIILRNKKGLTQADVAGETGKTKNAVASWEQGLSLPDITVLYKLSKVYNVEMEFFFKKNEEASSVRRVSPYAQRIINLKNDTVLKVDTEKQIVHVEIKDNDRRKHEVDQLYEVIAAEPARRRRSRAQKVEVIDSDVNKRKRG